MLHWWHAPTFGVRTKIVDDRLFLPYLVAEYIEFTGECEILAEQLPFLESVALPAHQSSIYADMKISDQKASLLEHCKRSISSLWEFSGHGLVKMQGGDWNDAMDKVGEKGVGSSVWCSMFLFEVMQKFQKYVHDPAEKKKYITSVKSYL